MPNNTAVREHLMTYLRELQVKATGGEQYEAVLEALSGLVQKTDRLYRRDDQGQHIPMTPEDYREIMTAYKTALDACGAYQKAEENEELRRIPGEIQNLLSRDVAALSDLDPNTPGTLPQAVADARGQTVDITGQKTTSEGANLSSRIPLRITDQNGSVLEGYFTAGSNYDPAGDLRKAVAKTTEQYPKYADFFNGLLDESLPPADVIRSSMVDVDDADSLEVFQNFLSNHENNIPVFRNVELTGGMRKALDAFSDLIQPAYAQVVTYNQYLRVPEGASIDKRNGAMSMMAALLGSPQLVAKSVPLTVTNGSETKTGTFMANAKGIDLYKLTPDAPIRDYGPEVYENGEGLRSLAELQILDYLCMNADRHARNMFYQFDTSDPAHPRFTGVQGIDNDASFGTVVPENNKQVSCSVPVNYMFVIPRRMATAIMQLDENMMKTALRGYGLSDSEVSAAWDRTLIMKDKIREGEKYFKNRNPGYVESGKLHILEDDDWQHLKLKDLAVPRRFRRKSLEDIEEHDMFPNLFRTILTTPQTIKALDTQKAEEQRERGNRKEAPKRPAQAKVMDGLNKASRERDNRELKAVAKLVKSADPFYMLKGSDQYRQMRERLKDLTDFSAAMASKEGGLTPDERLRYQALLEAASQAGHTYLTFKGDRVNAPTTSHERDRINAAQALCALTERKLTEFKSAAHSAEQEEVEQLNARMKAEAETLRAQEREDKTARFRAQVEGMEEGPLKWLGQHAVEAQQQLLQLSGEGTLTPAQQAQAREAMSYMTLYDMALVDRSLHPNDPHIQENTLKAPDDVKLAAKSLREQPDFKNAMKEWSPEELRTLALNGRARTAMFQPQKSAGGQAAQASDPAATISRSTGNQKSPGKPMMKPN